MMKRHRDNIDFVTPAEFQILKLLINANALNDDISIYSFLHRKSKVLYKAISLLIETQETITKDSLFREANHIDSSITPSLVEYLLAFNVDSSSFDGALNILNEVAVREKLTSQISDMTSIVKSNDSIDLDKISDKIAVMQDVITSSDKMDKAKDFDKCAEEYKEELDLRRTGKYYTFGDEFLDNNLTKKAAPGQVVLLASASGTGKSTYGLNLINGMINLRKPVMYFSLEMDTVSTMDRLLAMRSNIPVPEWYVSGPQLDPMYKVLEDEREKLKGCPYWFIDDPAINLITIQGMIRKFKMQYKTDYVCVFVDLITQVKEFIDLTKGSLASTIEVAVNKLNKIAKRENVCIVAIAQMNRDADNIRIENINQIDKLRPTYNNIKNSSALGERSRVVLSAFRPKYYAQRLFPDNQELEFMPDILDIQILKQSQGNVGMMGSYLFEGDTFKVTYSPSIRDTQDTAQVEAAQQLEGQF